jgi:hypothetical protein
MYAGMRFSGCRLMNGFMRKKGRILSQSQWLKTPFHQTGVCWMGRKQQIDFLATSEGL